MTSPNNSKKRQKITPQTTVDNVIEETENQELVQDFGEFDKENKEWVYQVEPNIKLKVGKLKSRSYVDIRYYWHDKPTKKGAFLSVETFKKIQAFSKLDEALKLINSSDE